MGVRGEKGGEGGEGVGGGGGEGGGGRDSVVGWSLVLVVLYVVHADLIVTHLLVGQP